MYTAVFIYSYRFIFSTYLKDCILPYQDTNVPGHPEEGCTSSCLQGETSQHLHSNFFLSKLARTHADNWWLFSCFCFLTKQFSRLFLLFSLVMLLMLSVESLVICHYYLFSLLSRKNLLKSRNASCSSEQFMRGC